MPSNGAPTILDPPVTIAGDIHDGADREEGGVGGDGAVSSSNPTGGYADLLGFSLVCAGCNYRAAEPVAFPAATFAAGTIACDLEHDFSGFCTLGWAYSLPSGVVKRTPGNGQ